MMGQLDQHERKQRLRKQEQEFLPGLPNDLVLELIATRISWSSAFTLSQVNRTWERAICSGEIYDLRKRRDAVQATLVAPMQSGIFKGFYDAESRAVFMSPPQETLETINETEICEPKSKHITQPSPCRKGVVQSVSYKQWSSESSVFTAELMAFLDGKLYAIEKQKTMVGLDPARNPVVEEVQVLDIAKCDRGWKRCCRYQWEYSSHQLCCGATEIWVPCNGKIYSFHTCSGRYSGRKFDPETNKSTILRGSSFNFFWLRRYLSCHQRGSHRLGKYCGRVLVLDKEIYVLTASTCVDRVMVFNAEKETWRWISNNIPPRPFSMIVIREKLYDISRSFVHVYAPESNSWTLLQPNHEDDFGDMEGKVSDIVVVGCYRNELVAWLTVDDTLHIGTSGSFWKSVGFGAKGQALKWEQFPKFSLKNCECVSDSDLVIASLEF